MRCWNKIIMSDFYKYYIIKPYFQMRSKYDNYQGGAMKRSMFQPNQNYDGLNANSPSVKVPQDLIENTNITLFKENERSDQFRLQSTQIVQQNEFKQEKKQLRNSQKKQKKEKINKLVFQVADQDSEQVEQNSQITFKNQQKKMNISYSDQSSTNNMIVKLTSNQTQNQPKIQEFLTKDYQQFIIKRNQDWLNRIWTQLEAYRKSDNQCSFCAKLTGYNKQITFKIYERNQITGENGPGYLGKVKTNFLGDVVNIYGPGFNPANYKKGKQPLRQLLATVEYEKNFFGETKPRNFKAYILKSGYSYYDDLLSTTRGSPQIPLNILHKIPQNTQKIHVLQNKQPQWDEQQKSYVLDFGGRAKKASLKNFIMQDISRPNTVRLVFGKIDDDQFRLDVSCVMTPLVGFGIALSSFGGKIGCL